MTTFRIEDGTILKTENATKSWEEDSYHDGSNFISKATGSQWYHQKLHRSRKGRYWIESWSNYQGSRDSAEWLGEKAAVSWLLANDHELPTELEHLREDIEE